MQLLLKDLSATVISVYLNYDDLFSQANPTSETTTPVEMARLESFDLDSIFGERSDIPLS